MHHAYFRISLVLVVLLSLGFVQIQSSSTGGSSPLTTNGDLYSYNGGDTRLPIGSPGQVLTVSGGFPIWSAPGGGTTHNLLSATHTDSAVGTVARGDVITGQTATPAWTRLALGGNNLYLKSNTTDLIYSTLAAAGIGSCTNQFPSSLNADAAPTCTSFLLTSAQFANQGTTTTLLHGNAAGNPTFGAVVSADHNITSTSCTNQFVTAISTTVIGTCSTATLASAQFANQGTTTTLLHGNAAGNPTFGAVVSADHNITAVTCTNQFLRSLSATLSGTCASVATVDVVTALKSASKSVTIDAPTTAATNKIQWEFPSAITITEVICSTDTGTVTIQLDERARATPNTAGTNVLTSSLVCDSDSQATTTFSNAGIAADVPLNLQITAVATSPGVVRVHTQYTID